MKTIKKFFKGIFIFFGVLFALGLVGLALGDKEEAETKSSAPAPVVTAAPAPVESTPTEAAPEEAVLPSDGIRPEVREALEAYEAFWDEYCKILSDYYANTADTALMMKYLEFVAKAEEMEAKMDALDSDLNDAEENLYIQVMLRCEQKLLAAAQ